MTRPPRGRPLLSVVTVVRDRAAEIRPTLESVARGARAGLELEHVVVDGGSTDGTVEILAAWPGLRWISEPDEGIYPAMNKGLALARGEWLLHVNAGDRLHPGAAGRILALAGPEHGYVAAAVRVVEPDGRVRGVTLPLEVSARDLGRIQEMPFPHQGLFVRRSLLEGLGGFDRGLRVAADFDLALRLLASGVAGRTTSLVAADYMAGGAGEGSLAAWETMRVARRHGRPLVLALGTLALALLRRQLLAPLPLELRRRVHRMRKSRHFRESS